MTAGQTVQPPYRRQAIEQPSASADASLAVQAGRLIVWIIAPVVAVGGLAWGAALALTRFV